MSSWSLRRLACCWWRDTHVGRLHTYASSTHVHGGGYANRQQPTLPSHQIENGRPISGPRCVVRDGVHKGPRSGTLINAPGGGGALGTGEGKGLDGLGPQQQDQQQQQLKCCGLDDGGSESPWCGGGDSGRACARGPGPHPRRLCVCVCCRTVEVEWVDLDGAIEAGGQRGRLDRSKVLSLALRIAQSTHSGPRSNRSRGTAVESTGAGRDTFGHCVH